MATLKLAPNLTEDNSPLPRQDSTSINLSANIVPFEFEGAAVRVVNCDGEPWFIGKDVADRLGYADPTNAMKQHCRGVVKHHPIVDALGRTQKARVLSEPDVLRLIIGSTLPAAQRFESWVFEEVLPSIRKTGGYIVAAPEETPEELALRALAVLQATVERQKIELTKKSAMLLEAEPKVAVHDRIAKAEGSITITAAAKTLQIRPGKLFQYLRTNRWIYKRPGSDTNLAYQDKIERGLLIHKTTIIPPKEEGGDEKISVQTRVTGRGLTVLARELNLEIIPQLQLDLAA